MADDLGPVLVTGASGYLGRAVTERLQQRDLPMALTSRSGTDGTACDLSDAEAVRHLFSRVTPSVVIHCAAHVPKSGLGYADEAAASQSTAMLTAVVDHAPCPIVFASSMTVYGLAPRCPAREDADDEPASAYARGKKAAEQALIGRRRAGDVAIRLPGLFGLPRRSGIIYQATSHFLNHRPFELTATPGPWAAMTVADAAECLVRAATRRASVTGLVLNAGYHGEFTLGSAVTHIAQLCGVEWRPSSTSGMPFSMNLQGFETHYGALGASFHQRLSEFVDAVRVDGLH